MKVSLWRRQEQSGYERFQGGLGTVLERKSVCLPREVLFQENEVEWQMLGLCGRMHTDSTSQGLREELHIQPANLRGFGLKRFWSITQSAHTAPGEGGEERREERREGGREGGGDVLWFTPQPIKSPRRRFRRADTWRYPRRGEPSDAVCQDWGEKNNFCLSSVLPPPLFFFVK